MDFFLFHNSFIKKAHKRDSSTIFWRSYFFFFSGSPQFSIYVRLIGAALIAEGCLLLFLWLIYNIPTLWDCAYHTQWLPALNSIVMKFEVFWWWRNIVVMCIVFIFMSFSAFFLEFSVALALNCKIMRFMFHISHIIVSCLETWRKKL